jgi:hypothetical protein
MQKSTQKISKMASKKATFIIISLFHYENKKGENVFSKKNLPGEKVIQLLDEDPGELHGPTPVDVHKELAN